MNSITALGSSPENHSPADSTGRELFELELRVARRADELAKNVAPHQNRDLEFWLRAEREIMAEFVGSKPDSLPVWAPPSVAHPPWIQVPIRSFRPVGSLEL